VAEHLAADPRVAWVNYPGLPDSPYHALAKRYLPKGAGGILSFGVKGRRDQPPGPSQGADAAPARAAGERFIDAATLMCQLANVGDARTLIIHPASTTHRQLSPEEQAKAGVPADMIRLSVGFESIDDIRWDIERALGAAVPS
jgi:O-acetylhomoserine (thiol)-lyase